MLQLDSRSIINLPVPVRIALIGVLLLGLGVGLATISYYLRVGKPGEQLIYNDAILMGLAIVQVMLLGLVAALLVLYSETDATTDDLRRRTRDFLERHLPQTLAKVSPSYESRSAGCQVVQLGASDIFGAAYELKAGAHSLKLWVGINVSRVIVIYWIDRSAERGSDDIDALKDRFRFTFGGAEKVGFAVNYEPALAPSGQPITSVWSAVRADENLLMNPAARLFWAQDLAMMTESFWRTALRSGTVLSSEEPCPL